jgi:hypothetical protein
MSKRMVSVSILASVTILASPAFASDIEGTVSAYGTALALRHAGAAAEVRFPRMHLSLTGSAAAEFDSPSRYYSLYSRWLPIGGGSHSFGLLAGYYNAYTSTRAGLGNSNSLLVGPVYQCEEGAWWFRLSPYIGWNLEGQAIAPALMLIGSIAGPSFAEIGWRPWPHVELGLRTSLAPLRIGYVW